MDYYSYQTKSAVEKLVFAETKIEHGEWYLAKTILFFQEDGVNGNGHLLIASHYFNQCTPKFDTIVEIRNIKV